MLKLFRPLRLGGRLLVIGDGLKVAKEGRKMPAVKKLHQSSANNSKATSIFGHSLQALGLLVCGPLGHLLSVPLTSPIHEGAVFSNRDRRTLLDKFVQLFLAVVDELEAGVLLVVDAYYASGKILRPLLTAGHHILTRVRWNTVAYQPAPPPKQRRRGRPRRYGQKVRLWDLWSRHRQRFQTALSPVYGESHVILRYYAIDLLWRPVGQLDGRGASHLSPSPVRTHRARLRQWAQDKIIHVPIEPFPQPSVRPARGNSRRETPR